MIVQALDLYYTNKALQQDFLLLSSGKVEQLQLFSKNLGAPYSFQLRHIAETLREGQLEHVFCAACCYREAVCVSVKVPG